MSDSIWSKSRYKLFISRWGIVVNLEAGYKILSHTALENEMKNKENCIKITDGLYVCFDLAPYPDSQQLTAEEQKFVCDGLRLVGSQILASLQNRCCLITMRSFQFSDCDIQDETFTASAIQWAGEAFGFPVPEIPVRFEWEQPPCGKYIFDFSCERYYN